MIKTAILMVVLAGPAVAGIEHCLFEQGHHREGAHRDLGGGIVSYEQSFLTPTAGQDQHVVENCASGTRVLTVMQDYIRNTPKRQVEVRAAFDAMAASDAAFGMADVRRRLAATGAQSGIDTHEMESCACAQAYPELRGNRETFTRPGG